MLSSIAYNTFGTVDMTKQNKFYSILAWLLPSGGETIFYIAFCGITLVSSNATFLRSFIYLPNGFQLQSAVLNSANSIVENFVGDRIAQSAVVAIFWAVVGLGVYVLIWLGLNFSSELGNDLAVTKFVHPNNVDTRSPLRDLISRSIFQFFTLCILIFYINLIVSVLLPYIGGLLRIAVQEWPKISGIKSGIIGIVSEFIILHFFTIILRIFTLRKRVFG